MMREINAIAGGQIKIGHWNVSAFDLTKRLAKLDLGHVFDGGQFAPAGFGDDRPHIHLLTTIVATRG